MRTRCPARTPALRRKWSASNPPWGMAAASASVRFAGRFARSPSSGQHTYCAYVPKRCRSKPNTRSPTSNDLASGPTESTSPESTMPSTGCPGRVPAECEPPHDPVGATQVESPHVAVARRHGRSQDADAHLVLPGNRSREFLDPEDFRRTVPRADDGLHLRVPVASGSASPFSRGRPAPESTTCTPLTRSHSASPSSATKLTATPGRLIAR